ncbi:Glycosyltransferase [Zostera marina]|uniref:Glycosyltransferase n=1 Tax=Zostera marina TaxID=29655 RepID=A0A0K9P0T0_ZOSMR|nr:Glycosyltransferase [Zostera marina]
MAKGSRKMLLIGILFLPFVYTTFLRMTTVYTRRNSWKFQLSIPDNLKILNSDTMLHHPSMHFSLPCMKRKELAHDKVSCISEPLSTMCVTTSAVRIQTGDRPVVYLSGGQKSIGNFSQKLYPRMNDPLAMERTTSVYVVSDSSLSDLPECDVTHHVPALVFSTGGFAGNFYHDINEVIIPLFITVSQFQSQIQLVITDHKPYWFAKYRRVLAQVSDYDIVKASSTIIPVDTTVHCFPGAIVGVKHHHNNLVCNSSLPPGGIDTLDFKRFLQDSFSLKNSDVSLDDSKKPPVLLLLSRYKSRVILNEKEVVRVATEIGFHVEVAPPTRMRSLLDASKLVNSCNVLMGVHGAGMTNMVFLPTGAVVLQVVPLGLDWAAKVYYGKGPTERLGLKYVEYKSTAEESSLYTQYPKDHPVLTDAWSILRQGYNVSGPLYTNGQNVTVNIDRLRLKLSEAMQLVPRSN